MKQPVSYRAFCVIAAFLALGWFAQPAFAQRGGHGGGGFHGGGGGFHGGGGGGFHGGGGFQGSSGGHYSYGGAGYRGGSYGGGYHGWGGGYGRHGGYGWRGGYYGWRGGYWGYPRYGYGWGFGFGWPSWGWGWGYPYAYGYSPWYGASPYYYPYSYPNYCPPGYSCSDNGNDDPPPADPPGPQPNANGPAKPWRPPVPGAGASDRNPVNSYVESPDVSAAPILSVDTITAEPSSYRVSHSTAKPSSPPRPAVQYAMRELREMPPFARQREIETGRYSHFSAQEKELLRSVN